MENIVHRYGEASIIFTTVYSNNSDLESPQNPSYKKHVYNFAQPNVLINTLPVLTLFGPNDQPFNLTLPPCNEIEHTVFQTNQFNKTCDRLQFEITKRFPKQIRTWFLKFNRKLLNLFLTLCKQRKYEVETLVHKLWFVCTRTLCRPFICTPSKFTYLHGKYLKTHFCYCIIERLVQMPA